MRRYVLREIKATQRHEELQIAFTRLGEHMDDKQ